MRRTITIPDELDKRIIESAKRNIRPIGSEISYIVQLWFNYIDSRDPSQVINRLNGEDITNDKLN